MVGVRQGADIRGILRNPAVIVIVTAIAIAIAIGRTPLSRLRMTCLVREDKHSGTIVRVRRDVGIRVYGDVMGSQYRSVDRRALAIHFLRMLDSGWAMGASANAALPCL
jgi:hypothetical protein